MSVGSWVGEALPGGVGSAVTNLAEMLLGKGVAGTGVIDVGVVGTPEMVGESSTMVGTVVEGISPTAGVLGSFVRSGVGL